ncbi:MAG: hypothetical protein RMJ52_02840, partial [Gemmataceae bacterium]|nr:hypothetical protein [Gemmataceae bacterium]
DFGLSKSLVSDLSLTGSGAFLGTPLYASPEQIKGERIDVRSDVYAVAATLYFLLTGRAPFQHCAGPAATLARIVSEPPPPLRCVRPGLSPALERVVLRGLQRDRDQRWRDLAEFRRALQALLPGHLSFGGLSARLGAFLRAWRSFLLWLPVALLLMLAAWLYTEFPEAPGIWLCWLAQAAAILLLLAYLVLPVLFPVRSPFDRLVGLDLVPA